jgi:hypothetical protein
LPVRSVKCGNRILETADLRSENAGLSFNILLSTIRRSRPRSMPRTARQVLIFNTVGASEPPVRPFFDGLYEKIPRRWSSPRFLPRGTQASARAPEEPDSWRESTCLPHPNRCGIIMPSPGGIVDETTIHCHGYCRRRRPGTAGQRIRAGVVNADGTIYGRYTR